MLVVGDRSTNPDCQLVRQEELRSWRGTVLYTLWGEGTYNSRNVILLIVVMGVKRGGFFLAEGVSGLLGLLPIRSTDEGTEKSENGEIVLIKLSLYTSPILDHMFFENVLPQFLPSICLCLCGRINRSHDFPSVAGVVNEVW